MDLMKTITSLTSRHVARCLTQLSEANAPEIYKNAVKREFWFLSDDIKQVISEQQGEDNELPESGNR